jgi:tRNA dimethylallyltransferase
MKKPLVIVITGPTGSGKTALSIRLAKVLQCSIVSADSRQVFKEIPIGSAAPDKKELAEVKHFLVGSHSIHDAFNAGIYEKEALSILNSLFEENKTQIVCGGTGLYIKALLEGLDNIPFASSELRGELETEWKTDCEKLKNELQRTDPEYAKEADLSNKQRVIRAVEIIRLSGKTYSSFRNKHQAERNFNAVILATDLPREELYSQIDKRTNKMISSGWLDEAKSVYPFREINALQTVGFKEIFEHFDGAINLEEAISKIQMNTRRYAKRQLTWIRNQQSVIWVKPNEDAERIINKIEENLNSIELS